MFKLNLKDNAVNEAATTPYHWTLGTIMKKTTYILIILFFLASCQLRNNEMSKEDHFVKTYPLIIDTFRNNTNYKTATQIKEYLDESWYYPIYFGKLKDTIYIDQYLYSNNTDDHFGLPEVQKIYRDNGFRNYFPDYWNDSKKINASIPDTNDLVIDIDTSSNIAVINMSPSKISTSFLLDAYPVYISNLSGDTLFIGRNGRLDIILQAKDSISVWRPIETPRDIWCGNGISNNIILPPDEIVIVACPIYDGDFETELRLAMMGNYSLPFRGTINRSQFNDRKFD